MSAPILDEVAGWDVPLLRGAVWTLDSVAGSLPAWRARVEAVGRSLGDARCWYGPAAESAGAALVEVSTVATAVTTALDESLEHAQRLLTDAEAAQELAERARAAAAAVPVVLDGGGRLVLLPVLPGTAAPGLDAEQTAAALRAQELAAEALTAASSAGRAASQAADALTGLGVRGALLPASFGDLAATLVPRPGARLPGLGPARSPAELAQWWAGLSTAAREEVIARAPEVVGRLDGLPAWARDEANRALLEQIMADPESRGRDAAAAVAREIAGREAGGEVVQLYHFVPEEDLVALATGDLDTADALAVVVPGVFTTPADDLGELADDAATIAGAAAAAAPGAAVAGLAWLGYRTPQAPAAAVTTHAARRGGPALAAALDGLSALRLSEPPRITVAAHSYGTVVTDRAADEPGELSADAVVLVGSPGLDNARAEWEVDELYEASAPGDPLTWLLDWHGWQASSAHVGATELPAGWTTGHTEYYDADRPTLEAIGEVVAGVREPA